MTSAFDRGYAPERLGETRRIASALLLFSALTPVAAHAQTSSQNANSSEDESLVRDAAEQSAIGTQQDGRPAPQPAGGLNAIIVTAQRREENLQDTPVSVSAFNAEQLTASGVEDIQDLSVVEPSLNVPQVVGVFLPFIRGIGNAAGGNLGNESSVPVYIDDLYYTRLTTAYLSINSIERVEVLKGPQGTLFGRNASGGAIQIFTKDPDGLPETEVNLSYANYDRLSGSFYTSTPITDTLSWNVSVAGTHQGDGWGNSLATGRDVYTEELATARTKLLWEPTDATSVKIVGFYAYSKGDIGSVQDRYRGTFASSPQASAPDYPNPPVRLPSLADLPGDRFYDSRTDLDQFARTEGYGASIRIDQDLGFADAVSITGFRNSDDLIRLDADITEQNFFNGDLNSQDKQITQEFQLNSKSGSEIDWILGAYYLRSLVKYDPITLYGDAFGLGTVEIESRQVINGYSVFGQATAPLSDRTNLTLGLRYNIDELNGSSPGFSDSETFKRLTWKGVIDYDFTDDIMGYASVSRGYKSGAYRTFPLNQAPALPEIIDSYEIGFKSELFDRTVRLNGALFWNDIKNPQVLAVDIQGLIPGIILTNAKQARVRGGELSVDIVAAEGLNLRGAVTYLDGEYRDYINAPFYCQGLTSILGPATALTGGPCPVPADGATGNRLPNVSDWSFNVGANYSAYVGGGELVADISASYTGPFAWNPDNYIIEDDYTLVSASLNFTPDSLDWLTIGLFGKNLLGEKYYTILQESVGPAGTAGFQAGAGAPRTYGARVTARF